MSTYSVVTLRRGIPAICAAAGYPELVAGLVALLIEVVNTIVYQRLVNVLPGVAGVFIVKIMDPKTACHLFVEAS